MILAVRTSTGFEPVISRYRCDAVTNWAIKQLILGAGHDTDSLLNAFTRLTSRRGVPEEMISGCGTNCVGTVGELIEHICKLDQNKIQPDTSYRCLKWNFTFRFHWLQQYLPLLNRRPNWTEVVKDFKINDIVLVLEPNLPRGQWPLGCITETYPGRNGHTRNYKLPCGMRTVMRPIHNLCLCRTAGTLSDDDENWGELVSCYATVLRALNNHTLRHLSVWGGGNGQIIIAWRNCFNLG